MYIPSTQIDLIKIVLEDFELAIPLDNQILACLYKFIFDPYSHNIYFENSTLMDTALALKDIVEMEQLTSLEGLIEFFKGEERAIDTFATDIQYEVEQLLEKATSEEENYSYSDDLLQVTTSVAIRPALSKFVIGPSKSRNEQFQEVFKEQNQALRKMIFTKLRAIGIDYNYYMEDILQQAILDTLLKCKDSASLPPNINKILFNNTRNATEQICKYEKRKSDIQIKELENKLIDEYNEDSSIVFWQIDYCIERLPERLRQITRLNMQGLSIKEIATLTCITPMAIRNSLHRAYIQLRADYIRVNDYFY